MLTVERELPTEEARALLELTMEIARGELAPKAPSYEAAGRFPREEVALLGKSGLLGLPYDERYGGGGQPYVVYLQVVEEVARVWATVAETISVHTLACYPLARFGTEEQRDRWLPDMLAGDLLGAYCLSEPNAGSDAGSLSTRAVRNGDEYVVSGTKAWITHGGVADFYNLLARTGEEGPKAISCLLAESSTPGMSFGTPERKMGFKGSPTAQVILDEARVPAVRLIGQEGQGFAIAMSALESGRLGIAACAVGLAQAALDAAVSYARERRQFGKSIMDFQGVSFVLADMATAVTAGRELYLAAARRRDAGLPFAAQAAMAKLYCADMAMKVTTDAVQVHGGYGYVEDYPVERYMREAKVLQIVEGTSQIQRMVIGRALARG